MEMYQLTVFITARSQYEAKHKLNLLLEWAEFPVKKDLTALGVNALAYWINSKSEVIGDAPQSVQTYAMPLSLPGNSRQEAEARLDLILQWASFPVSMDWKALLGSGIKMIACRNAALNEQQGNTPEMV